MDYNIDYQHKYYNISFHIPFIMDSNTDTFYSSRVILQSKFFNYSNNNNFSSKEIKMICNCLELLNTNDNSGISVSLTFSEKDLMRSSDIHLICVYDEEELAENLHVVINKLIIGMKMYGLLK